MNPALTFGLLGDKNSIDFNTLSANGEVSELLAGEGFSDSFTRAWQEMMAKDGNLQPLDLAVLEGLGSEQLVDIAKLSGLPVSEQFLTELSDTTEFTPQQLLVLKKGLQKQQQQQQELLASNPAVSTLLNVSSQTETSSKLNGDIINNEISTEVTLNAPSQNKPLLNTVLNTVDGPEKLQAHIKNNPGLEQALDSVTENLENQVDKLFKTNIGLQTAVDNLSDKQNQDVSKLLEHYSAVERPQSSMSPVSNQMLQPGLVQERTGTMLRQVDIPVSQPGWGQAVGDRLLMMVNDKMQSAHILLNPPELGPIEVRVNVNNDQASVHFVSGHTAVRDAIEEAFPRLKEMFMQQGLSLTDANVSQHSSQQGQQYSSNENQIDPVIDDGLQDLPEGFESNTEHNAVQIGLVDHYV